MAGVIEENRSSYMRRDLFEVWLTSGQNIAERKKTLQESIINSFKPELLLKYRGDIQKNVSRFCSELAKRWKASSRNRNNFLTKNTEWLNNKIIVLTCESDDTGNLPSSSQAGRPRLDFADSSDRTKRRKTEELRSTTTSAELAYALKMNLRSEGKHDAAKVISDVLEASPNRASRIRHAWQESQHKPIKYTSDEALSLLIDIKLTKHQYTMIRLQSKMKNADIYPPYNEVRSAKKKCYPNPTSITLSETVAEVNLQHLLDHTLSRILLVQEEMFEQISLDNISEELNLILKWGCDGSTGHSQYKQILPQGFTDTDIFLTSLVPLQLNLKRSDGSTSILWQNPHPSSVRSCRPLKIQFAKETAELSQSEIGRVEQDIENLRPCEIHIKGKSLLVRYTMLLTMIDGKICNAASFSSSSQTCYICHATPKEMNLIDRVISKPVDHQAFRFGLSTLHAWIRFFECLLHVSYRLPFEKWQARGGDKEILKARKEEIQQRFRQELGLLVDQVKPGGSGTSNDGNTARIFFKYPEVSARITGVNIDIICRFGTILRALSSGYTIQPQKFDVYAKETARLFVHEYPWFYMPVSVHKILIHGSDIIQYALLPIGQLSEEAQECRNKDLKMYRRSHTRRTSRINTIEDLLNCLLVSSDPYITSLRKLPQKQRESLGIDVLQLLCAPETVESSQDVFEENIVNLCCSDNDSSSESD